MIRLSQLTLIRGTKVLLEAADVVLNPGDKIGLIGANGTGKSSLFALLRGELHQDQGEFDYPARWRVAHVAQETPALDRPALEYAIDGDTTLRRLETELAAAEAADDGMLMGELYAALGDADAYTVRSRAEQLLYGLGFSHEQMESRWRASRAAGACASISRRRSCARPTSCCSTSRRTISTSTRSSGSRSGSSVTPERSSSSRTTATSSTAS